MGETAIDERNNPADFFSAELRDGKIFAQNLGRCVEESYPVAYNLGCGGKHWSGWVNVDSRNGADLIADLRDLPIDTDSADAVAAIHVLEHFYHWEVEAMLGEWRRILKPGGKMILELPCMDKVFGYVAWCVKHNQNMAPFMTTLALWGDPQHKTTEMMHKWGWFVTPLREMLEAVGMQNITFMEPNYHFKRRDIRVECVK